MEPTNPNHPKQHKQTPTTLQQLCETVSCEAWVVTRAPSTLTLEHLRRPMEDGREDGVDDKRAEAESEGEVEHQRIRVALLGGGACGERIDITDADPGRKDGGIADDCQLRVGTQHWRY